MDIDYQQKITDITKWLRETVQTAGFSRVVVAVSGGVDSAVSLSLAVQALGKENVYALLLPYGDLSQQGAKHANVLLNQLGIAKNHRFTFDIKESVDSFRLHSDRTQQIRNSDKSDMSENQNLRDSDTLIHRVLSGNIMARVRMIHLFDFAKKNNCLVIGTENKSEHYLGYYTRFGDEASDIEPIRGLYKTQVWEIAKVLGVPKEIITKAPTAGLWESQTDEKEFGFSYLDADRVLYHHFEEGLPNSGIVALGIPKSTVENVLAFVAKNDFKNHLPRVFK